MKKSAFIFIIFIGSVLNTFPLFSLTFEEAAAAINDNYEMQHALLELDRLEAEIRAAGSPEDIRFAFNPALTTASVVDGDFAEETKLSGYASVSVPFSLSGVEKDRVKTLQNNLAAARLLVDETRAAAYIRLFALYQDLWLLQQEAGILEAEVKAGELYMEMMQERFKTGGVTLAALNNADETMIERQEDLSRNTLEQRLTWFELSLNTGIKEELPVLEAMEINIADFPRPPELEKWIIDNHPVLARSRIGIAQLEQNLSRQLKADYDLSIRPFWNYDDHSVSLNYNIVDPEITAGYNFPIMTQGEIPSKSSTTLETWNTGVTLNFSIGTNRYDKLSAEAAELAIEAEKAKYDFLVQTTLLKVRSSYQQLLRSRELVEQAERNLERSTLNRKIVEARRELNQAPIYEVLEAEANEARAKWKLKEAVIESGKAYLNLQKEAALFEY